MHETIKSETAVKNKNIINLLSYALDLSIDNDLHLDILKTLYILLIL